MLKKQGKLDESMDKYKQALDIQLRVLGPGHADVGSTYGNLGNLLSAQRKSDEALASLTTLSPAENLLEGTDGLLPPPRRPPAPWKGGRRAHP